MKRRDFLKGLIGGAVATILPKIATAKTHQNIVDVSEPDNSPSTMIIDHGLIETGDIITIGNDPTKFVVTRIDNTVITFAPYKQEITKVQQKIKRQQPYYRQFEKRKW